MNKSNWMRAHIAVLFGLFLAVLIAFVPSTTIYAENTTVTPKAQSKIDTKLGWKCKSEFLVSSAGTYLGHLNQYYIRDFYKKYNGYAIAVFGEHSDSWVGPILISTVPEYVISRVTGVNANDSNDNVGHNHEIEYKGLTWYINTGWHVRNTSFTSPLVETNSSLGMKDILDLAGVEVYRINLSNATLTLPSGLLYVYNGSEQKPAVTVSLNGKTLAKDSDYTVTYSNNIQPGTALVTINGVGQYTGSVTRSFTINAANDLSKASVMLSQTSYTYDGNPKEPSVTVTIDGKTLTKDTDYSVSYIGSTQIGTATVYVRGNGYNYGETSKTYQVKLATPKITSLKSTKHGQATAISSAIKGADGYQFTFKAVSKAKKNIIVPSTSRKATSSKVVPGAKYSVTVKAKATQNGKTYYSDASAAKIITIKNNNDLSKAIVKLAKKSYKYDGKAKKPTVTVTINSKKLKKGTDYTVTYKNNKNPGTATVTVKGKGNYKGSKKATFKITGKKSTTKTTVIQGQTKNKNSKQTVNTDIKTVKDVKDDYAERLKETIWIYNKAKEDILKKVDDNLIKAIGFAPQSIADGSAEIVMRMISERAVAMLEKSPTTFTSCSNNPNKLVKKILDDLATEDGTYSFKGEDGAQYTVTYHMNSFLGMGATISGTIKRQDKNGKLSSQMFGGASYNKSNIKDTMNDLKQLAEAKIDDAVDAAISDAKSILGADKVKSLLKKTATDKAYGEIAKHANENLANKAKKVADFAKKMKDLKGAYNGVMKAGVKDIPTYNKKLEAYINAVDALF